MSATPPSGFIPDSPTAQPIKTNAPSGFVPDKIFPEGFKPDAPGPTPVNESELDYLVRPMLAGPLEGGLTRSQAAAITSLFPSASATLGALLGEGWGSVPGAAIGGSAGKALQTLTNRWLGLGDVPRNSLEAASAIGKSGAIEGVTQAASLGTAKLVKPLAAPLAESAARGLGKVFAPTRLADKAILEKSMARLAEERPLAFTRAGMLESMGKGVERAGAALDEALDALPAGKRLTPQAMSDIAGRLDAVSRKFMATDLHGNLVPVPGSGQAVGFLNDMKTFVGSMDLGFENVRRVRQVLDGMVDQNGKWALTGAEGSIREIQRDLANSLRAELAKSGGAAFRKANADFSFYKGLQSIMEHTLERQTGQTGNLTRRILTAAGAVSGSPAGPKGMVTGASAFYVLSQAMDSTAWRTASARAKWQVADALASDRLEDAVALMLRISRNVSLPGPTSQPKKEAQ